MNHEALFWELAAELQRADPRVIEGAIMSSRCLRVGSEFLAMVDAKNPAMVVKLPQKRVAALIEGGVGQPFAPAKKVFKEWLAVPTLDRELWQRLLLEGLQFVGR